jgi:hypothetical protein
MSHQKRKTTILNIVSGTVIYYRKATHKSMVIKPLDLKVALNQKESGSKIVS